MGAGGLVGPPHHSSARYHLGPRPLWCGALGAPPQVPSGLRKLPDVICSEEKISPNFDDIFRVDISETKKLQETRN